MQYMYEFFSDGPDKADKPDNPANQAHQTHRAINRDHLRFIPCYSPVRHNTVTSGNLTNTKTNKILGRLKKQKLNQP